MSDRNSDQDQLSLEDFAERMREVQKQQTQTQIRLRNQLSHIDFQKAISQPYFGDTIDLSQIEVALSDEYQTPIDKDLITALSEATESTQWKESPKKLEIKSSQSNSTGNQDRHKFTEESVATISRVGNVSETTAKDLYNKFWESLAKTTDEVGARLTDDQLAVIATVAIIYFLYTGNINSVAMLFFNTLTILNSKDKEE